MAPDRENPDFSFLHEGPSEGDSSVLAPDDEASQAKSAGSQPPAETKDKSSSPQASDKEESLAWMDHAQGQSSQDSGTRFAAAVGGSGSDQPASLFNFEEKTEAIDLKAAQQAIGEETLVDEQLAEKLPPADQSAESAGEQTEIFETEDEENLSESAIADFADAEQAESSGVEGSETAVWRKENVADVLPAQATVNEETLEYDTAPAEFNAGPTEGIAAESNPPAATQPQPVVSAAAAIAAAASASVESAAPRPQELTAANPPAAAAPAKPPQTSTPVSSVASRNKKNGTGKSADFKMLLLISYASAITLVCVYLVMQSMNAKPHELESLPDLIPPMQNDEIAYRLAPEAADMPKGHTLKLGESRRFGNVRVTPLRVEKAPVQFAHFSGDPSKKRPASPPVLKLWLKFENVSKDQKFAPLDRELLLSRIVDPQRPEYERSNQFVAPAAAKGNLDRTALLFNLEKFGDWNFAGLDDQRLIAPGESVELYLPASEAANSRLGEPLIWRVQFRKGYHPESFRGVTTLIEVHVDPAQIKSA